MDEKEEGEEKEEAECDDNDDDGEGKVRVEKASVDCEESRKGWPTGNQRDCGCEKSCSPPASPLGGGAVMMSISGSTS